MYLLTVCQIYLINTYNYTTKQGYFYTKGVVLQEFVKRLCINTEKI